MKPIKLTLLLILSLFIFKPNAASSQKRLPTGLYKLDDSGDYTLTLDGKTYYANAKPIALSKNIKSINVIQDRGRKVFYNLNIELDADGTKNLKDIPLDYAKSNYIGVIVQGELVSAPRLVAKITTGNLTIGDKFKAKLEEIANKLKAEQGKK